MTSLLIHFVGYFLLAALIITVLPLLVKGRWTFRGLVLTTVIVLANHFLLSSLILGTPWMRSAAQVSGLLAGIVVGLRLAGHWHAVAGDFWEYYYRYFPDHATRTPTEDDPGWPKWSKK